MKTFALVSLLAVGVAVGATVVQDVPRPNEATDQHEWLQQLVGEWDVTIEMSLGPETEPMQMESSETVRSIGDLWIVAEGNAEFGGIPVTTLMTLGYDPQKKAFVGTWIDSMHSYMWHYTGALNEAKTKLTLEAEGPSFDDPTRMAMYRDAFEIKGPDHKVLTSSMKMEDGTWMQFVRADYHRKRAD